MESLTECALGKSVWRWLVLVGWFFSWKGWGQTRALSMIRLLQVSGLKSRFLGQQCYLFVISPVPLEVHTAILPALDKSPPASIGLHVTEHLEGIGWWWGRELEAPGSCQKQVWASPILIWPTFSQSNKWAWWLRVSEISRFILPTYCHHFSKVLGKWCPLRAFLSSFIKCKV